MIKSLLTLILVLIGISGTYAQNIVSVRDLNTYPSLEEYSISNLQSHSLVDQEVTFTAVIISNPKSSGLATPFDTDDDGSIDQISRIHVFVTDTAAVSKGREGMSIQIIETDWELFQDLERGDVITVTGKLYFFIDIAQMTADQLEVIGSVFDSEFDQYSELLEPWEVTVDELNILNPDNTYEVNISNYSKFNGAYVRIVNGTISNVSGGTRPDWSIDGGGSSIPTYDHSLRFRNDRNPYYPTFNYRREEDSEFIPPVHGTLVNISGFITMLGGSQPIPIATGKNVFGISPFEDGVYWNGDTKYVNGADIGGGEIFNWPVDLQILAEPPYFSNLSISNSSPTSDDIVSVSIDAYPKGESTIEEVRVIYSVDGVETTEKMQKNNNSYSFSFPKFQNFTTVYYRFEAVDSKGLTGVSNLGERYSYLIQDGEVNSISIIQKTETGKSGPSPFVGFGVIPTNITGVIVSDYTDGVIVLQESALPWSGIFLEHTPDTDSLVRGDEITIVSAEIKEAEVSGNSLTLTQLVNMTFDLNSSGNDIEDLVPVLSTDFVAENTEGGELEPFEGMLVKFEDVMVSKRGDFGEYTLANKNSTVDGGAIFNENISSDQTLGDVDIPEELNRTLRQNMLFDAYGIVAASFGFPKFHPRNLNDIITDSENKFTPLLDFYLLSPDENENLNISEDVEFSWRKTKDLDGDSLTYEWVLLSEDTSYVFHEMSALSGGYDSVAVIPFEILDGILASVGLDSGETADFLWTIQVNDGFDSYPVHTGSNYGINYKPLYRNITLERTRNAGLEGVDFEGSFNIDSVKGFVGDTLSLSLDIENIWEVPIEAFELKMTFDTSMVEIIFPVQEGFLTEDFLLEVNSNVTGEFFIAAAGTGGIDEKGSLIGIKAIAKSSGRSSIEVDNFTVNETALDNLSTTVFIIDRLCGDVTNDRSISVLDANFILRNVVQLAPQFPLQGLDSLAADVTANGDITAFDASLVLQHEVGLIDGLLCSDDLLKEGIRYTNADWEIVSDDIQTLKTSLDFTSSNTNIYAIELEMDISKGISFKEITQIPEGWHQLTNRVNKKVNISLFGLQPIKEKFLELEFAKKEGLSTFEINGLVRVNEAQKVKLRSLSKKSIPDEFELLQNYPNPFNPATNISYSLPQSSKVELVIYNMLGQKVSELVNTTQEAGVYSVTWDSGSLSTGMYIYRLTADGFSSTKKMMLIK